MPGGAGLPPPLGGFDPFMMPPQFGFPQQMMGFTPTMHFGMDGQQQVRSRGRASVINETSGYVRFLGSSLT